MRQTNRDSRKVGARGPPKVDMPMPVQVKDASPYSRSRSAARVHAVTFRKEILWYCGYVV